ncbi:hypothetical protein [Oenococcus kitaharae]|nr:hypothetical protein [Oenococcus kitaharae]MCV3296874.1 hypothetical protein [Oenococcus kitaharae]
MKNKNAQAAALAAGISVLIAGCINEFFLNTFLKGTWLFITQIIVVLIAAFLAGYTAKHLDNKDHQEK